MKLTEKELNEFPIGTKITYYSDDIYIKVLNTKVEGVWCCLTANVVERAEKLNNREARKVEIPTYTEYIPPKPILDDKEKEYLSAVIRPWRYKIKWIRKNETSENEFIDMTLRDRDEASLPCFKKGTMYKGMELDKEYSLDELGL